eukprot:scaffold142917_cov18-Tisochrysis_lutea.AAC.1
MGLSTGSRMFLHRLFLCLEALARSIIHTGRVSGVRCTQTSLPPGWVGGKSCLEGPNLRRDTVLDALLILPTCVCNAVRLIQGTWQRRMLQTLTQPGDMAALHKRCVLTGPELRHGLYHLYESACCETCCVLVCYSMQRLGHLIVKLVVITFD